MAFAAALIVVATAFVAPAAAADVYVTPSLVSFHRTSPDIAVDGSTVSIDWEVREHPVTTIFFYFSDSLDRLVSMRWDGGPAFSGTVSYRLDASVVSPGPLTLWGVGYGTSLGFIHQYSDGTVGKDPMSLEDPIPASLDFPGANLVLEGPPLVYVTPSLVSFHRTSPDIAVDGSTVSIDWEVREHPVTTIFFYFSDSLDRLVSMRWDGGPAFSGTISYRLDASVVSPGPLTLWGVGYGTSLGFIHQYSDGTVGKDPMSLEDPIPASLDFPGAGLSLVRLDVLTAAPVPTISGTTKVGSALTANAGTWGPGPVALAYQWYRTGVAITGATAKTYVLAEADAGKTMAVQVSGSQAGFASAARTSSTTVAVAKGTLYAVTPAITGTRKVGYTLTAAAGTWGPATVALTYQWYRSGAAITGATAKTYKLAAGDLGKTMTVKVTGSKPGYTTAAKTSPATAAVVKGSLIAPTPTIIGTKKVGYTLAASPGTWGPGIVTLTYRWYRSGVAIAGAGTKTYKLVSADRYDTIKVRVTGVKTGYTGVGKYSASTVKIP